uniref:Pyrrolo-quinoline quinone repeat domain-containing protein n=1 Tax=Alexandrium catenella TaxID=2925 RepID=A0A7S1SDS5_ALECA
MPLLRLLLLQLCVWAPAEAIQGDGPPGTEDYYWPKRAGTYVGHGAVPFDVPTDLSRKPAWTWDNPYDELFRHGPVIDGKKNIYAVTSAGWIRKFSPDGVVKWTWRSASHEGKIVTSPFLYKGQLFLSSMGPGSMGLNILLHCFDMETGKHLWAKPGPKNGRMNHDSSTVHVAEGVVLGGLINNFRPAVVDGNNLIFAMNASSGDELWQVTLDEGSIWNFMPSTPGDGTFFFSTNCGGTERRHLSNGSLIWRGPVKEPGAWCSTGGGTLGPNGVYYAETNNFKVPRHGVTAEPVLNNLADCIPGYFCPQGMGLLVAYRAEDGEVLWKRRIHPDFGGWQYPTVGKIDGRLLVVAAIGTNPSLPEGFMGPRFLPQIVREYIARFQWRSAWLRWLLGVPKKRNAVAAYDADTGALVWLWEEPPWEYHAAAGDEELLHARFPRMLADPRNEVVCGPDNWGIPAITADGTVIVGSGSSGNLYAIRDRDGDGSISSSEVSTLETHQAFLNGPALAPGLMAVAPCWGKMYVFKSDSK